MDTKKYIPKISKNDYRDGYRVERQVSPIGLRAEMAWLLIEHFGAVAGKESTERGEKIILQSPEELIDRCFRIVELYLERVELLGELVVFAEAVQDSSEESAP